MQSVNGAQFLNITSFIVLFEPATAAAVFGTIIVPLTCVYTSLQSHKRDFNIVALNLVWLLVLYVLRESSFISAQIFVLNLYG